MQFAELRSHPLFTLITTKEKLFVEMYLTMNGDMEKAVRAAFPQVIRVHLKSLELQRNENVSALLGYIDRGDTLSREELKRIASRLAKSSKSERIQLEAARLSYALLEESPEDNREAIKKKMREIDGKRT